DEPLAATFITSPAPNAGAIATNRRGELTKIPEVLQRRAEYLLALAAGHGYRRLSLGAWGCGGLRKDPSLISSTLANHLKDGEWAGRFDRVVFSVLDTSVAKNTIKVFESIIG